MPSCSHTINLVGDGVYRNIRLRNTPVCAMCSSVLYTMMYYHCTRPCVLLTPTVYNTQKNALKYQIFVHVDGHSLDLYTSYATIYTLSTIGSSLALLNGMAMENAFRCVCT